VARKAGCIAPGSFFGSDLPLEGQKPTYKALTYLVGILVYVALIVAYIECMGLGKKNTPTVAGRGAYYCSDQ
jgi:hypothetical protein